MKYIKYLSQIAANEFIKNQSLKFTPLNEFNDPFEGGVIFGSKHPILENGTSAKIAIDDLREIYKSYLIKDSRKSDINSIDSKSILDKLCSQEGIACLCLNKSESGNADNSLMWAHYSVEHKGIAIGFNPEHEYFKNIADVHYTTERLIIDERIFLENKTIPVNTFFAKSDVWQYENEVRLSKLQSHLSRTESLLLDKIPLDAITHIYLGCKCEPDLKKQIFDFCELNNIRYFPYRLDPEKYGLELDSDDIYLKLIRQKINCIKVKSGITRPLS